MSRFRLTITTIIIINRSLDEPQIIIVFVQIRSDLVKQKWKTDYYSTQCYLMKSSYCSCAQYKER